MTLPLHERLGEARWQMESRRVTLFSVWKMIQYLAAQPAGP